MRARILPALLAPLALSLAGLPALSDEPASAQQTCGEWRAIDGDEPKSGNNLFGVTAERPGRVWVAGSEWTSRGEPRTLIRRWNGSSWDRERSANTNGQSDYLRGIDSDEGLAIAVGETSRTTMSTLALRRTRRGWKRMNTKDPSPSTNGFEAVDVLAKRAWAVGTRWDGAGNHRVLVERFANGTWKVAPVSNIGLLSGVSAGAWNDVWAVGRTVRNGRARTLTLRFNGRRWRTVSSPNRNDAPHYLYGVAARTRTEAWAVGEIDGSRGDPTPIVMKWNGNRWSFVPIELPERAQGTLRAVSVHGDEVVAVGHYSDPREGDSALILVNDGSGWERIDTTRLRDSDELTDVDHAPDGSVFAVGYRSTTGGSEAVYRRSPPC